MQKPDENSIQEATNRVKQQFPIEKLREDPEYRDISQEAYDELFKTAETYVLLLLEIYTAKQT